MSWHLLQRFLDSDVFNSDPFLSVSYLSRYADHIGIHHVLCNKLRQFPYEDIEFFLPQLCHLIISVNNESMALEEFLLDLCEESVTAALLTFWLFQTYLHDLSSNPQTDAFQTCRRVYNKVQHIVFGLPDTSRQEKITENVLPVTVLASFVLASIGLPMLPQWAGPMAIAQARKPAPPGESSAAGGASDTEQNDPPKRPTRSQTVTPTSTKSRRTKDINRASSGSSIATATRALETVTNIPTPNSPPETMRSPPKDQSIRSPKQRQKQTSSSSRPGSSSSLHAPPARPSEPNRRSLPPSAQHQHLESISLEARLSSSSLPLPDMRSPRMATRPPTPVSAGLNPPDSISALSRRHSHHHAKPRIASVGDMTSEQKARLLRQNYFRCETQFLRALEDISNRLVSVPKAARLSALRAELALIGQDLPAEVDIPVICPPSLVNGIPSRSRHHRIVRLNPAESTVLNSAEKVPYLLMVEILREDFTFDPDSADNQRLLVSLVAEQGSRKRIFDLSDSVRNPSTRAADAAAAAAAAAEAAALLEPPIDSVFEPTSGDLGNSPMLKPFDDEDDGAFPSTKRSVSGSIMSPALAGSGSHRSHPLNNHSSSSSLANRHASGGAGSISSTGGAPTSSNATAPTALSDGTPRSSAASTSRSSSPGPLLRKMTLPMIRNQHSADQPDFSALATHMRTASQMLAQLDQTSGKRPRQEVAAIRAKIIASMQSLEEQSFDIDDNHGPTFDTIVAKTGVNVNNAVVPTPPVNALGLASEEGARVNVSDPALVRSSEENEDAAASAGADAAAAAAATSVNPNAGIARMENDFKTGGLQRKGDRDDPSAAVFGEAWDIKRERIRRSSPYGWMKNWDLVSVIVKTGADLRQEAFACQLIAVCDKIWEDAGVSVWVKQMRILVTGESSGLIETITNGVSLHSIKRSLTLASIESGQNPRRRIATLKDYFVKAFGASESEAHRAGVDAFKRSLAAYSMISYVLQLKDRHNGNVLVDNEGHIVHIDFGFMLSNSPGSVAFEAAPFKLTHEYVEVLGGIGSSDFDDYKRLCKQAFQALRKSADNVIDLVSMMGRDSKMPCFVAGVTQTTANLRQRFQLHLSAEDAEQFVETELIAKSLGSYYTRLYDTFQYRTQGIY
ncbi:phosphatidylinositol 4-kinase [Sporothrix schenckii 1099-18]|uniref:1-phosphatidylinositol 4-kinase n=1 Tax=Sporothrix schenckii 1099-18 TaxID=1397361 RepID=A0A0F2MAJ7_SPOSC|nr:phosphatidylinositol 4-kinase [Sporothrix schenckii 1099-18]KJR85850.1 phosphatidylinositol 4-kinase [Sporothrix schenckii 1099-18]